MQIAAPLSGRRLALAACAVALAAAPAASAKPVTAQLRVEADGKVLAPGNSYVTDTTQLQTDQSPGCDGTGGVKTIVGPSALGIVDSAAQRSPAVRPFAVSDKFSFGLFVCGIGGFSGSESKFWLYKVDHKSPEVGADQFGLKGDEQVLWYYVDTDKGVNTGDELSILAPARARSGQTFEVTVYAYDAAGNRRPAAGALVFGQTVQKTDAGGKARIFSQKEGQLRLRAGRGADIPSGGVSVCLNRVLARCPAVRGERIVGTDGPDRVRGTGGADVVDAGGGNDRIDVRGGSRDRVRCGRGRDAVRADRRDRVARDCERVRRG